MTETYPHPQTRGKQAVYTVAGVLLLLIAVSGAVFLGIGGRFLIVETPSMGTYAPVGTLVLQTPGSTGTTPQVGQMILFTPPGGTHTYFHRVVAVDATGITTRGDLNAATDPWRIQPGQVQGTELAHIPGLGWLLRALPILVSGFVIIFAITHLLIKPIWRFPTRLAASGLLFAATNLLLRPWFRAMLLSQRPTGTGTRTQFVVTGILPLQATVTGHINILAQPGRITQVTTATSGDFLRLTPAVDAMTVGVAITLATLPLLVAIMYSLRLSRIPAPAPKPVNTVKPYLGNIIDNPALPTPADVIWVRSRVAMGDKPVEIAATDVINR